MIRVVENPNVPLCPPGMGSSSSVETELESSLIQRSREDSHAAFGELVRRNQTVVRAVLGRYLRDDNEVDELAQRAFIAAYRSLDHFRGESSFTSWLVSIARRQAAMYLRGETRRRKREVTAGELALLAWTDQSIDEQEVMADRLETLVKCLQRLPPTSTEVVTRYYFRQQTIAAIAHGLGRSQGAIRMLLMRIRRSLAACISQRLSDVEGSS